MPPIFKEFVHEVDGKVISRDQVDVTEEVNLETLLTTLEGMAPQVQTALNQLAAIENQQNVPAGTLSTAVLSDVARTLAQNDKTMANIMETVIRRTYGAVLILTNNLTDISNT